MAQGRAGRLVIGLFQGPEGHTMDGQRHPERAAGRYLRTPVHAAAYVVTRTAFVAPHAVLPYAHSDGSWRPGFKPLRALTSYVAGLGYVYGWYRHPYR